MDSSRSPGESAKPCCLLSSEPVYAPVTHSTAFCASAPSVGAPTDFIAARLNRDASSVPVAKSPMSVCSLGSSPVVDTSTSLLSAQYAIGPWSAEPQSGLVSTCLICGAVNCLPRLVTIVL